MATVTLKGNPIHTSGSLPAVNSSAPNFTLTKTDLSEVSLKDFAGKKIILNIFPSLDTPTCSLSVKAFNKAASELANTAVLCISADLPFAQTRFCGSEELNNVIALSSFRHHEFGEIYGVTMTDGPIRGLLSRAVVVIDESGKVTYTEQVAEIAQEPNYEAALKAVK